MGIGIELSPLLVLYIIHCWASQNKSYIKIFANSFLSLLTLLSRVRDLTARSLKLESFITSDIYTYHQKPLENQFNQRGILRVWIYINVRRNENGDHPLINW